MKPLIFYIDDEPRNLAVFEASMPDEWEVRTFDSAAQAMEAMTTAQPFVVLSDQRMPGITGVQCLEVAKKLCPNAVRIVVTGYSDEELVVESVRKAQIFDYIRKPWDPDELESSLSRAIEYYKVNTERQHFMQELKNRELELQTKNLELMQMTTRLEASLRQMNELQGELECWVPPFVLWALKESKITFPIKRDIVGITFDIINSSEIHDVNVGGKPLRAAIIQAFSEAILRHGGWRESHSGDSAYGHFGLLEDQIRPHEAAMAVAREFRSALRSLCEVHGVSVECGIALHEARNSTVDVHSVLLNTPRGTVKQKSFDTTASDIDLLHRMEKLVHTLPGSNVIMSEQFLTGLGKKPANVVEIGSHRFRGQSKDVNLYLMVSDLVKADELEKFKTSLQALNDGAHKKAA